MSRSLKKLPQETWSSALWCNQSDHPECYCLLFPSLFPTTTAQSAPSLPALPGGLRDQTAAWPCSAHAPPGARGHSHRGLLPAAQEFPWVPPQSVHSRPSLPRTRVDTFLLIVQVSTHSSSEITVLVSLPAYSMRESTNFLKDSFTKCFWRWPCLNRLIILPTACLSSWTSHPHSGHSTHCFPKWFAWLAHFLTFHQKKHLYLLSTPSWELKTRSGVSKSCYMNKRTRKGDAHAWKHLLCISTIDATYILNLI